MISAFLQGGLGNYMFQIAATQALAWDLGVEAKFDFNSASQVHRNIRDYQNNILGSVIDVSNPTFDTRYFEPDFGYNELHKIDNQILIGYFQSEKYFKHHKQSLIELFSLPNIMRYELFEKYKDVINSDVKSCSIHVRRGDYLKLPEHHPPLTMDYYNKAMELIKADKFLIFSDDISWCKDNFIGDQFVFVEDESDYKSLILMSLCYDNIIANSSFSWWGAWLNRYEHKTVIAPNKWFGPAKGDIITKDLIPEEWLLIG
jgi:hypothetical protein